MLFLHPSWLISWRQPSLLIFWQQPSVGLAELMKLELGQQRQLGRLFFFLGPELWVSWHHRPFWFSLILRPFFGLVFLQLSLLLQRVLLLLYKELVTVQGLVAQLSVLSLLSRSHLKTSLCFNCLNSLILSLKRDQWWLCWGESWEIHCAVEGGRTYPFEIWVKLLFSLIVSNSPFILLSFKVHQNKWLLIKYLDKIKILGKSL